MIGQFGRHNDRVAPAPNRTLGNGNITEKRAGALRVAPVKASLGLIWGGAIRLHPLAPNVPMVIGEGILAVLGGRLSAGQSRRGPAAATRSPARGDRRGPKRRGKEWFGSRQ
jgi:hypothetical protein